MSAFVTVDGVEVDVRTALGWQLLSGYGEFVTETVRNAALLAHCEREGIVASAAERQRFLDRFRHAIGLRSAAEFERVLRHHGLTRSDVESFCEIGALRAKLMLRISEAQLRRRYAAREAKLLTVALYAIYVPREDLAHELRVRIEEGGESYLELAVEYSVDAETHRQGGYLGPFRRDELPEALAARVFAARPGAIIGPVKELETYAIYRVGALYTPDLDDLRAEMRQEAFEEMLDSIAAQAAVDQPLMGVDTHPLRRAASAPQSVCKEIER